MAFKRSSNSAGGLQAAFDSGTAAQKAAFQASVSGGRTGAALAKKSQIGRAPLTVSGIGNSIMYTSMPWVIHACALSGGMLIAYDSLRGVPGNGTGQMLGRMADVPAGADLVAIMECTNDADNGTTFAQHESNMRGLIEFYLSRGQLPFGCFPPARSDNQASNIKTFQLGMLDYIIFSEYGCPFYFPWRQFTAADANGQLLATAGAADGKHPGDDGHRLAGAALLDQMIGADHALPLPVSNNQYGGIGVFADPLNLTAGGTSWSSWGSHAKSIVTDSSAVGNWVRIAMTGATDAGYQRTVSMSSVGANVGDNLLMVFRLRTGGGTGGLLPNGYALGNLKSLQSLATILPGYYTKSAEVNGIMVRQTRNDVAASSIPDGTSSLTFLGALTSDAPTQVELAQFQVWNLSAVRRL